MNRTVARLIASPTYGNWPWPQKLPLKKDWYYHLSRRNSIADETRTYFVVGDMLLICVLLYSVHRVFRLSYRTNGYQTHECFLTNSPPAIIANDFNFSDPSKNRKLERHQLDQYRESVVECKAKGIPVESVIFNF